MSPKIIPFKDMVSYCGDRSDTLAFASKGLTRRHWSEFIAALACVSLITGTIGVAAQTVGSAKIFHAANVVHKKSTESAGRRTEATKSKEKQSASRKIAAAMVPLPRARPDSLASGPPNPCRIPPQPATVRQGQAPPQTSDPNVALAKTAIDCLRSSGAAMATQIEATISDPVARKLVEWIILRTHSNDVESARYAAFVTTNAKLARHWIFSPPRRGDALGRECKAASGPRLL